MTELRSWLADPDEQRRLFLTTFPKGLDLSPGRDGSRAVWEISGGANLQLVSEADSCRLNRDPKGERSKIQPRFPLNLRLFEANEVGYYLVIAA
jgi:hypothetical protein